MSSRSDVSTDSRTDGVEVAHYWGEGDGSRMFEATLEAFRKRHPSVRVTDRSYDNHGLAIKGRILREDPPPVFVEWPDRNLVPYGQAGALRDLTELWEDNGWEDAYIEGPRERARLDGEYVAVPVNIHRMNNLFYDVELVEEYGVDPSSIDDPRELAEVLADCDDGDVIGMHQAMKNPQTVLMLWANLVIGQFGAEVFEGITRGNTASYEQEIESSLRILDQFAQLASDDAPFLDMVGANDRFTDGKSVFFYQGDWVAGEYEAMDDYDYGEDWGCVPFPGTDGVYMIGTDAFVASADVPLTEDARTFLEFVGSVEAQETLNRAKGSIPPRRDVPMDDFPPFLQEQFDDFERARHFPAGHALQVTPDAFVGARAAMSDFVTNRDVERATGTFVDAYGATGGASR